MTSWPILSMQITSQSDVVAVRQRAKRIADLVGFDNQEQTRIATAVSEIARNAFEYAGRGIASFRLDAGKDKLQILYITIKDEGPGIENLQEILDGRYASSHGLGIGITGARRLMEKFRVDSQDGVTVVEIGKPITRRHALLTRERFAEIAALLAKERPESDPHAAMALQNQELALSLDEITNRQEELGRLNRELEDTNRGVVALYGELEQKADELKQASELKTRFLSHMSHEFRTPLNSILALSDLLIKRVDGQLTEEQETQVSFIKRSAESLYEMVNDLLDIAKLEAGRLDLHVSTFTARDLLGGLRGVMKPLQRDDKVRLVFEDPPPDVVSITSDEGKLVQIIRNFVANALKFTIEGEVRVSVSRDPETKHLLFSVKDTGIGIAPNDRERIFEEFSQIDSPTQRMVKGTGLGLSLCRKLADLLGGRILLESKVGKGSTFTLDIPELAEAAGPEADEGATYVERDRFPQLSPLQKQGQITVLIVDDDAAFRYALRQMIAGHNSAYNVIEAPDGAEGVVKARDLHPDVIVLDLQMPRRDGYQVLSDLSSDPETSRVPVLLLTSADYETLSHERIAAARGFLTKRGLSRDTIASALNRVLESSP